MNCAFFSENELSCNSISWRHSPDFKSSTNNSINLFYIKEERNVNIELGTVLLHVTRKQICPPIDGIHHRFGTQNMQTIVPKLKEKTAKSARERV